MTYQEFFKSKYPEEAVGYLKNGEFFPLENIAATICDEDGKVLFDKTNSFEVDPLFLLEEPDCLLHSHTRAPGPDLHPCTPSKSDLAGQVATAIEWGICYTDGDTVSEPVYWGNPNHRPPLLGRPFIFNMYDCYELLRDFLYAEKGVVVPSVVRDPYWHERGDNFTETHIAGLGLHKVPLTDLRRGDAIMYVLPPSPVPRHVGIWLGDGNVLSHFFGRVSDIEPYEAWSTYAVFALRHTCLLQ